jgi:hypothetical protein
VTLLKSRPSNLQNTGDNYRMGCGNLAGRYMLALLVAGAIMALLSRSVRGAAIAAVLLGMLLIYRQATRRRFKLAVSPQNIAWSHPERGSGMMYWRDIGALIIRDFAVGEELALYLVPRAGEDPEESPGGFQGFILTTEDLGKRGEEGEAKIRDFVIQVMPFLDQDIILDRGTQRWLDKWGIRLQDK